MSIMCWNCRGFKNRQIVHELGSLVREQDPIVIFLAETWLDETRLFVILDTLKFGHHHGVSKITHGGGLALFWKKDFDMKVESSSLNHIDIIINGDKENAWSFTGFYGAPETQLRTDS